METKYILFSAIILLAIGASFANKCDPEPGHPPNSPFGVPQGLKPGRVGWVHSRDTCKWDGKTNYWWNNDNTDEEFVSRMLIKTISFLTQTDADLVKPKQALDMLFRHFNEKRGINRGYSEGEQIAIKINLNSLYGSYDCNTGNGLSPQMLKALLRFLVKDSSIPQENICVYDASRWFANCLFVPPEGSHEEFPDVRYIDNQGQNGREAVQPDMNSHLQFSSTEVPAYNVTYLPTCLTQADYAIIIDNLRGHDVAGVTLSGKTWFGSIYRPDVDCGQPCDKGQCHWCPMSLHKFINVTGSADGKCTGYVIPDTARVMGQYTPLVDLLGHDDLGQKTMLFLMDGLYSGPTEQTEAPWSPPAVFHGAPFNDSWSCSILGSQDPIALDSVAFDILRNQENIPCSRAGCVDNYLHEGATANDPPSGTVYNPTGKHQIDSLGVHEHWNNPTDKKYTGGGVGVDLMTSFE